MARTVGDVEVLGVGVREFTIEMWDTVLFSISIVVTMLVIDPGLTLLALLPVPVAMLLAHASVDGSPNAHSRSASSMPS